MKRWTPVLASSVVAAAFIGPGTIATATRAGADHGFVLLWALGIATVVCWVLQEASARTTVARGRTLGEALRSSFGERTAPTVAVALAVISGCVAYEAGNILGGVAGLRLVVDVPGPWLTAGCGLVAAILLARGGLRVLQTILSLLVAWMGLAFVVTAIALEPDWLSMLQGLAVPRIPDGGLLVALGLVGTTVVPYNLFLGSGVVRGQSLGEMRWGLAVVVGLGGLVSMAVLVVGTAAPEAGFEAVAMVLSERLGSWARGFFALGLFAAGFTSALTAPMAAQITWDGLLSKKTEPGSRGVALGVLAVGVAFGVAEAPPIPVIVLAQALNGLLLPVVAVALLGLTSDGVGTRRELLQRAVLWAAVGFTLLLGARGVAGTLKRWLPESVSWAGAAVAVVATVLVFRARGGGASDD